MTSKPDSNSTSTLSPKDPFWDDPIPEPSITPARRWPEDKIEQIRDELFAEGSEFKFTTRDEVVGIDNVLVEIDRLIHWLRNSKAYQRYGARLEPGVIFEGDPGTGKTLLSRFIASESGALFVNVRDFAHAGSLFRDADIADLFKRARATYRKTKRPVVLFWDEFENGAVERANATPEQAATVSQLTAELDGIHGKNEGILLIGCTNYIYGIDAALRRSGRMGLQIEFHAPDRAGKKLLLEHYLGKYKTKGKIDVDTLSYFFNSDDTAADIEESCMEAWRVAIYRTLISERRTASLTQEDIIQVFLKRLVGPPTAFINLPLEDRFRIAVHEVGHAIMALVYDIPLRLITVQPGKKSLGRTITAEVQEHIGTLEEIVSDMRVGIGSIAAEAQAGIPPSVGSTGDIEGINKMAVRLVDSLPSDGQASLFNVRTVGMARSANHQGPTPNVSQGSLDRSDNDVKLLLDRIEADSQKVMASLGQESLREISNRVNETVTLTGHEFEALFKEVTGNTPQSYRPGN